MHPFENEYAKLVQLALVSPERGTRNGATTSLFGYQMKVDLAHGFPLLLGRKMFPRGILGELAAMLRGPKTIEDFTKWGCNYWGKWANKDGTINVDYGNAWLDFNGVNQLEELRKCLQTDPTNRRMIVSSWRPDHLAKLSLPCCHYSYQFYVCSENKLHMIWIQRSVDIMIGLPSDIVFAAAWLAAIAEEFKLGHGTITLQLGDCHVYNEHLSGALQYLEQFGAAKYVAPPTYALNSKGKFEAFEPDWLELGDYNPQPVIEFLLKE